MFSSQTIGPTVSQTIHCPDFKSNSFFTMPFQSAPVTQWNHF